MEVRASLPRLDPGERQGHDGGSDGDELDRPKPPVSRPKPNVVAVPMDDDPEAVVFQLVQPSIAGRHDSGEDGPSGADEPRRLATVPGERRPHQPGGGYHLRDALGFAFRSTLRNAASDRSVRAALWRRK